MDNEVQVHLKECPYANWEIELVFPLKNQHGKPLSEDVSYWKDYDDMSEEGAIEFARALASLFVNAKVRFKKISYEWTDL